MGPLPVFVFPTSLSFYSRDPTSFKQIMTLYNPYDFPLVFQVLSNAPQKYSVRDPTGTLKPRCCIDIIVKLGRVEKVQIGRTDKFRIQIYEHGRKENAGTKDISATLFDGEETSSGSNRELEDFHRLPADVTPSSSSPNQHHFSPRQHGNGVGGGNSMGTNALALFVASVCIASLTLPTEGDLAADSILPHYLHLTVPQKLVAAYVLGLVTMVLLRPS